MTRRERRDLFDAEDFDTEDKLDRAIAGVFLIVVGMLALVATRSLIWRWFGV